MSVLTERVSFGDRPGWYQGMVRWQRNNREHPHEKRTLEDFQSTICFWGSYCYVLSTWNSESSQVEGHRVICEVVWKCLLQLCCGGLVQECYWHVMSQKSVKWLSLQTCVLRAPSSLPWTQRNPPSNLLPATMSRSSKITTWLFSWSTLSPPSYPQLFLSAN